jgi:DNA-binding MarR family transcriptional regulator
MLAILIAVEIFLITFIATEYFKKKNRNNDNDIEQYKIILKILSQTPTITNFELIQKLNIKPSKLKPIIKEMERHYLIQRSASTITITDFGKDFYNYFIRR